MHHPPTPPVLGAALRVARRAVRWAASLLSRVWSAHCELLRTNTGYATAVAAAAAAACTQLSWGDILAVLVSAAVAIWTAVRNGRHDYTRQGGALNLNQMEAWS